jgi:hypothetical protein
MVMMHFDFVGRMVQVASSSACNDGEEKYLKKENNKSLLSLKSSNYFL